MNKNDFLLHLKGLEEDSKKPQNIWESKQSDNSDELENFVLEHIESYLEGSLNESASAEDKTEAIMECVNTHNEVYACVLEYLETGNEDVEYVVEDYLDSYFGDDINESTISEDDIMEAFESLRLVCDAFDMFFESD